MKLIAALILSLWGTSAMAAATTCNNAYYRNVAPDILVKKMATKTQEVCYEAFAVMHSGMTRSPLWSAEYLTIDSLRRAYEVDRVDEFHRESSLKPEDRAELNDYARSGYDRGHMAPAANMPSMPSQTQSFSLANMIPQHPDNNRKVWADIEASARSLTEMHGSLYTISGPLYVNGGNGFNVLNNRVVVPTQVFKAVYSPSRQQAAVYITNNDANQSYAVVSLEELKAISGIDVFPQLSPAAKQGILTIPEFSGKKRNKATKVSYESLKSKLSTQLASK